MSRTWYNTQVKRNTPSVPGDELTEREEEVLAALANDRTVAEVCDELQISRSTFNGHLKELLTKTGCKTRTGLVLVYVGAVDPA